LFIAGVPSWLSRIQGRCCRGRRCA
jgi:hypothetical protein